MFCGIQVKEKVKSFYDSKGSSSANNNMISASVLCLKSENGVIKQEEGEYEEECVKCKFVVESSNIEDKCGIKTECIDIKSEEDNESETIHQNSPSPHMLIHKDSFEVQTFKCIYCSFNTKYKHSLKNHILSHERNLLDPEEATNIKTMLRLRSPVYFEKFTCALCGYTTLDKKKFSDHQLRHEAEEPHRCSNCDYKTCTKSALKIHMLLHKSPSEIQMYKCDICNYETRYKSALKKHQKKHKTISETQMHKCLYCNHETKYKASLKYHIVTVHGNILLDPEENLRIKRSLKLKKVLIL